MDPGARSRLLNAALAGRTIRSVEFVEEEGYGIIRLATDGGEVVVITGLGLDVAAATDEEPSG